MVRGGEGVDVGVEVRGRGGVDRMVRGWERLFVDGELELMV